MHRYPYLINIASPNEKNLYFSFTASLYAFITLSLPAKVETSIISVDCGKWKFVIKLSTTLNLYPGYIKILVHPLCSLTNPLLSPIVSNVLVDVVPTEITALPLFLVSFIISALYFDSI